MVNTDKKFNTTVRLLTQYIANSHNLTEDKAKDIIGFALGTDFIVRAMDDKVGRLIKEGYFDRIH